MRLPFLQRTFASVAAVKPPLQFKHPVAKWKPSEKDAAVLNSIAEEFNARIIRRNQGDQLAANLAYGLTETDIERVLGDSQATNVMKSVLSLKFADQKQLNQFNKHQAMQMFSRGPNDTGSPEVQVGVLTVRIAYLMKHAETHKHDYSAKRLIVELIHDRKNHLKYLRRLSLARYFEMLDKLGLRHDYLESFENPYLYRYRAKPKPISK